MTAEPASAVRPATVLAASRLLPERIEKAPPCGDGCVGGGDPRAWIGVVAQRAKLGLSEREAFHQAWNILTAVNPFPASLGRICPHDCQANCTRSDGDGAVQVNAMERFLGDWGLENLMPLPLLAEPKCLPESIGVVGAGPAGLSFAYQMARRGYRVTVYEQNDKAGGMLQYGVPQYRLPEAVLNAEVQRILNLGVELRLDSAVGRSIPVSALRDRHAVTFVGIGASRGLMLGLAGEDGAGMWTGTGYLALVNQGVPIELGSRVIVVGGGNTAIDAARCARRTGADVTVLYRRTRHEMPAIEHEVADAILEGVRFEFLAAPTMITREQGAIRSITVQRMSLGAPDASGRRAPVPVPDSYFELPADSVIAAVSQQPSWDGLDTLATGTPWAKPSADGHLADATWVGGDVRGLGVAGGAIRQGRLAAESAHASLRGIAPSKAAPRAPVDRKKVKIDFYAHSDPVTSPARPVESWLAEPDAEIRLTISTEEFLAEAARCLSCGLCFGCEQCFMFCNNAGVVRAEQPAPGRYFEFREELCLACGKCVDLCPCGFLQVE